MPVRLLACEPHPLSQTTLPRSGRLVWASAQLLMSLVIYPDRGGRCKRLPCTRTLHVAHWFATYATLRK